MKTREKIVIAILLGVLASWLFSCTREHYVAVPSPANGTVDAEYLKRTYAAYNDGYFQNKLTQTPQIDMLEPDKTNMASTTCEPDGGCVIHFNPAFVAAQRVADQTMLHEQCHIKTWMQDMDDKGKQVDHGKHWRACMFNLDTQGAFREILIDGYAETMP
jgi:hypothetical protein